MRRTGDSVCLSVNGKICLSSNFHLPEALHIGFRGGSYNVFIDDVIAYDREGSEIFRESFASPFRIHWEVLALSFLLAVIVGLFLRSSSIAFVTAFNMSLVIGVIAAYFYYFLFLSDFYPPNADFVDWHGKKVTFDFDDVVRKRILKQYPLRDKKPYILFIGSSQTWGAGASVPRKAYPYIVEGKLRTYFHDSAITVINAGICGTTSDTLYSYYTKEWYLHSPLLTVIDLSHNDHDSAVFKKYIHKFLEFNKSKNIKTLLIAEPNNYFREPLNANHQIMIREGEKYNVETVPIQHFIDSCGDSGFIWWDWVHMTDYGYCLFAEALTPYIERELEKDSLLVNFNRTNFLQIYKGGQSHFP